MSIKWIAFHFYHSQQSVFQMDQSVFQDMCSGGPISMVHMGNGACSNEAPFDISKLPAAFAMAVYYDETTAHRGVLVEKLVEQMVRSHRFTHCDVVYLGGSIPAAVAVANACYHMLVIVDAMEVERLETLIRMCKDHENSLVVLSSSEIQMQDGDVGLDLEICYTPNDLVAIGSVLDSSRAALSSMEVTLGDLLARIRALH